MNLYVVYDRVSKVSSSPFCADSHFEAYKMHVSSFQSRVTEKPSVKLDINDFELHYVGSYNPHYITDKCDGILSNALYFYQLDDDSFEKYAYEDGYITITPSYLDAISNSFVNNALSSDDKDTGHYSRSEYIEKFGKKVDVEVKK